MYAPAAPGACWVMECQECFAAVLITKTLEELLVNNSLRYSLRGVVSCAPVITFRVIEANCVSVCQHGAETEPCDCAALHELSASPTVCSMLSEG